MAPVEALFSADQMAPGRAACLVSVLNGATTWPEVIRDTGLARATVHYHLHKLRDEGLVAFEDGVKGTLRPCIGVAASSWGR